MIVYFDLVAVLPFSGENMFGGLYSTLETTALTKPFQWGHYSG